MIYPCISTYFSMEFRWAKVTFTIEKSDINSLSVYFYIFGPYRYAPITSYRTVLYICGHLIVIRLRG